MAFTTPLSDADILRLQEKERRFRKEAESMSRLHALALRLGETPDMRAALRAVFEAAVETQDAQFGLLSLYDRREGFLHVRASIGFDDRIRSLGDPDDIADAAAKALGQHLSVNRCAYARMGTRARPAHAAEVKAL